MAFDGITVHAVVNELNNILAGCRIVKIAQPEESEIILTIKGSCGQQRLLLSANASLPLVYLMDGNKPSPDIAPNFCMLLRKHIQNGRIISITQPGLERIIEIEIEHLNELGDICTKRLICEMMGKHSNIIFVNSDNMIIDSIKHISSFQSSVREVLPGREYFIPNTMDKNDALCDITYDDFKASLISKHTKLTKAIYTTYTGISPAIANEMLYRARLDGDASTDSIDDYQALFTAFNSIIDNVKRNDYYYSIYYENNNPFEFSTIELSSYADSKKAKFDDISSMLRIFYSEKNIVNNMRQKSSDLRHILNTLLERNVKKLDLQRTQLKDTEKKDKFKLYGELLHTYGYNAKAGDKSITCVNYYDNSEITIPLDSTKSPMENASKYFDKYQKMKRTEEALSEQINTTLMDIDSIQSILNSLDFARNESDLIQIKEEMGMLGYIRYQRNKKKEKTTSKPLHYKSSDGYDIYVGKNNLQNDEITFKLGNNNDWWFHAKKIPGSHVLLRSNGDTNLPDRAYEEAACLAAYYSKGKEQTQVEIDYLQRKNVKKPNGAKPGFVVYYTNYSMSIKPDISSLVLVD